MNKLQKKKKKRNVKHWLKVVFYCGKSRLTHWRIKTHLPNKFGRSPTKLASPLFLRIGPIGVLLMNDDFRSFSRDNNRKPLPADRQSMRDSWRLHFVYFVPLFIRNGQRFVSKWKTTNGTEGCRRLLTGLGKGWVKPCTARHRVATRVKHRRWHREEAALALANNLDMKRGRVKSGLLWKMTVKRFGQSQFFFLFFLIILYFVLLFPNSFQELLTRRAFTFLYIYCT